ncbi:hypothetical protein CROQUDRAFT_86185 [Cronartium quercuum f. sp. fusiforme G11]|uniref:Uncharacterized protein n=1 Tax=Cronartium quercuum f. sp. fusiforme G11 TaxID=708437 RepID=A0A9P6NRD9_9BASI|nr:hypothetical protein CROQUDRAFT_86185 [Cronartium quercuum f. sp. fusiforme G11]
MLIKRKEQDKESCEVAWKSRNRNRASPGFQISRFQESYIRLPRVVKTSGVTGMSRLRHSQSGVELFELPAGRGSTSHLLDPLPCRLVDVALIGASLLQTTLHLIGPSSSPHVSSPPVLHFPAPLCSHLSLDFSTAVSSAFECPQ